MDGLLQQLMQCTTAAEASRMTHEVFSRAVATPQRTGWVGRKGAAVRLGTLLPCTALPLTAVSLAASPSGRSPLEPFPMAG